MIGEITMRIWTVAIAGSLAVALSVPAAAQRTSTPDLPRSHKERVYTPNRSIEAYEACETKAHALGMPHGQAGHTEYVRECMGYRPRSRPTPG
jgi:hypothetical protein